MERSANCAARACQHPEKASRTEQACAETTLGGAFLGGGAFLAMTFFTGDFLAGGFFLAGGIVRCERVKGRCESK